MSIQEYSTTPGSNSTISSIDVAEGCAPSGINNAIRQFMADVKSAYSTLNKSTTYTVTTDDFGKLILADASGGNFTVTLPAAATAGDGFQIAVLNTGANGTVTVDGNAAETINDAATFALSDQYDFVILRCDGSEWWIVGRPGTQIASSDDYRLIGVRVLTGSGTYTPTSGTVAIRVIMVGGGASGAGVASIGAGETKAGAGGGGGATLEWFTDGLDSSSYTSTYAVGAGASGGTGNGSGGAATTWNDGTNNLSAGGGTGGNTGFSTGGPSLAQAGDGGAVTETATGGNYQKIRATPGGDGNNCLAAHTDGYAYAGFGGGSALSSVKGNAALTGGASTSAAGTAGAFPGGGGSGAVGARGASNQNGGSGANGTIIVYEYR